MKKINRERQYIKLTLDNLEDMIGTVDEIISFLQNVKERYGNEYINLRIEYDDMDFYDKVIYGSRLENDKEYIQRIKKEEKAAQKEMKRHATVSAKKQEKKKKLESERRALYEELKNEFG